MVGVKERVRNSTGGMVPEDDVRTAETFRDSGTLSPKTPYRQQTTNYNQYKTKNKPTSHTYEHILL